LRSIADNSLPSQAIRDLEWVLTSPDLLSISGPVDRTADSLKSAVLDSYRDRLSTFLSLEESHGNARRVGRYFERLVLFYLQHVRQLDIVASGLQIHEQGRTIGELDFVFRDESGQLQHWETAVKFYLYYPNSIEPGRNLIGPDPHDSLSGKYHRLFNHQLPLSRKRFPEITARHAFVKGRIFYHPEIPPPASCCSLLCPEHLRGIWLYCHEISQLCDLSDQHSASGAQLLKKPFWLSPADSSAAGEASTIRPPLTITEIRDRLHRHFQNSSRPQLVSLLAGHSSEWCEVQRVFVVPQSWPDAFPVSIGH